MNLNELEGAVIVAHDGQTLGTITRNKFAQDSVTNEFGQHGSQFSQLSIFNQFGPYGSQFSQLSPFNMFSSTPPSIHKNGKFIGYLTANLFHAPRIDVEEFSKWLKSI